MTDPRLDSVLQAATSRIQAALSDAVERVSAQLGPLALSATSNYQRQALMNAERDLSTRGAALVQAFNQRFRERTQSSTPGPTSTGAGALSNTDWAALSLVDNAQVERDVIADKLAQQLAHDCDASLEALNAHMATLLQDASPERNPIRPQSVAKALLSSLADIECDIESTQTLTQHIGRLLGQELDKQYAVIVQDLRRQGIQAQGLAVQKTRSGTSLHGPMSTSGAGSLHGDVTQPGTLPGTLPGGLMGRASGPSTLSGSGGNEAHMRAAQALSEMFGVTMPGIAMDSLQSGAASLQGGMRSGGGATQQAANADFQNLIRQIALQSLPATSGAFASSFDGSAPSIGMTTDQVGGTVNGFAGPLMAANLIRAHREELVRASGGAALDQMVIDIVAALFDQVLSDPKVSPQMARQIARLQMPVLRVALGDMSFFNSRKHPVRRFVNRVATLSASFDDYDQGSGLACLERITSLVNDIVEGDFDRMDLYETKLAELESFIESENELDAAENAAVAALLSGKEADLRVQQRYMQILKRELSDVEMPEFVRDFLAQIWSQVQVMAAARDGADSPMAVRMKKAGHELALSVQPKGNPQLRKSFLLKLPQLMKDLNEGMALIQWSEDAKQAFFGQLLPEHAASLKAPPPHDLTLRLLEQRLSQVEKIAIPSREEAANDPLPASLEDIKAPPLLTVVAALSPEEIKQAGFVPEAALTGDADLDINLDNPGGTDPTLSEIDINLDAPPPPSAGLQLVHHIQKGAAYQMMMQGKWKKVRLTWISEGRSFFIFMHGHMHKETISLTARTLAKMCDSGRFKAFEQAELIERATVRARRQLAALGGGGSHPGSGSSSKSRSAA